MRPSLERSGPEKSHSALMAGEGMPVSNRAAMADLRLVLSPLRQNALTKANTRFMSELSARLEGCDCRGGSAGPPGSLSPNEPSSVTVIYRISSGDYVLVTCGFTVGKLYF